jgi:hypothetical protein
VNSDIVGERGSLLAIGVELEGVRVCLIEPVAGPHRLVGWLGLQRDGSMETPSLIASACRRLGQRLGRTLWDERKQAPFLESDDPLRFPPVVHVALSLAIRPPLRIWLVAVSATHSLAALEMAVAAAPVQVVGRLIAGADPAPAALAAALRNSRAEVVVVAGGFDDPAPAAQRLVLTVARQVAAALALIEAEHRPALVYAGNRHAAGPVSALLTADAAAPPIITENIQPGPGLLHGRELARILSYEDWRLSERLPGYGRISRWATSPGQVSSLVSNFAQLTRIWLEQEQLPVLHALCVTPGWRLHVLAERQQEGVRLRYAPVQSQAEAPAEWPPIQLLSGGWAGAGLASRFWWDREGLAPMVAALGQVAPLAMLQVLSADLLEPIGTTR